MSQLRTNSIVPVGGIPAGASGGGIIQCVQTVKTDTFTTSLASAAESGDITGFTATITPRSTSNKILVMVSVNCSMDSNNPLWRLYRGGTLVSAAVGDAAGSRVRTTFTGIGLGVSMDTSSFTFIDSPSSTSALTYSIRAINPSSITRSLNINIDVTDSDSNRIPRGMSSFILMEVSG